MEVLAYQNICASWLDAGGSDFLVSVHCSSSEPMSEASLELRPSALELGTGFDSTLLEPCVCKRVIPCGLTL